MRHYSTYQSQFIEMFGQVSEESPRLNDIAHVYDGTHKTPTYTNSGIPFISVENISDVYGSKKYISKDDYDLYKHKPEYGDIFMTRIGSIGKCAVYESHDPLAYYVSLALIKPNKDIVHPKFLKYYIESTDGTLELKKRSLLKAFPMKINLGEIGKIKVIVPAKDKQLEFVKVAEQADKSKFISLKSQFIEMFGTLDNPKGEIESLGSVCNIHRGGSPRPISEYITDQSDGLNWIKIGDTDDSMYITKTEEKIKPSGLRKTREVYAGDLLLSNSMSFGRPYILKIDGCIHDGWLVLHINDAKKLSPVYLCSYLSQQGTYAEMAKLAAGGVVQNLNSNIVKQLDVIVPDMKEQIKYIQILEQADKSKYIN